MTTYVLEMRSTANWQDIRYREYSTSAKKAEIFKSVPRISFTDSGHGIVPHVREHSGRREPRNMMLADHVQDYIKAVGQRARPKPPSSDAIIEACAKIAEPWAGFWLDENSTDADRAVVAVRKEIAAKIRALSPAKRAP